MSDYLQLFYSTKGGIMKQLLNRTTVLIICTTIIVLYSAGIFGVAVYYNQKVHLEDVLIEPTDESEVTYSIFIMSKEDASDPEAIPQKTRLLTTVEVTHDVSLANSAGIIYVPEGCNAIETHYYVNLAVKRIVLEINN